MKKNFTLIALLATAIMSSCGSSDKTETTAIEQDVKPRVKVAKVVAQDVPQTEEYTTTVEAMAKNNIIPSAALRISKILVEVGDFVKKGDKLVELDASSVTLA